MLLVTPWNSARVNPSPSIVYVLPDPVYPYTKIVALYPFKISNEKQHLLQQLYRLVNQSIDFCKVLLK